jgi:protease-4
MVFALVLLVLLVFSFFINLSHFAGGFARGRGKYPHSFGPKLEEVLTEDNEAVNKIAVLAIEGIITSRVSEQGGFSLADVIKAELKHAGDDNKVRAIILKVDSPGGEVLASDEIYREIADFQKLPGGKPVIASMGNLAASGGYYVSAPCQWIVANDLTITGSIGVIMHSWNYRGLMNKVGLRPETYKSGKFKDMLSGERNPEEIPPEEREMVQSLIDETYGKFKKVVGEGRKFAHDKNKDNKDKMDQGTELSPHWTDYADGRVLSGTEAHQLGFVDQLGNFADAVKRAKTIAGISEANLIEYQQRYDLSDILRLFGQTGQTQSRVVKVDLGMDVPKLQAGQLYFLSPTFTH